MTLARLKAVGGKAALFLLAFGVSKAVAFFGSLAMSQAMSVSDYGVVELALSAGMICAQLLSLGIPGTIPQLVLIRKEPKVDDLLFFMVGTIGAAGLLAAALAWAVSDDLLYTFAALTVVGAGTQLAFTVYCRAMGLRYGNLLADNLSLYLVLLLCGLVFAVSRPVTLPPLAAGSALIAVCVTAAALAGLARSIRPNFAAAYHDARRVGFFMMINGLVYFAIANSSRILLGFFQSVEAVSVYSVCFRIATGIVLIHQLFATAFFRSLYGSTDAWFDRFFLLCLGLTMLAGAGVLVVFDLYGPVLLPAYAAHFAEMKAILPIVCIQVIWWVSQGQIAFRLDRGLITRRATPWLVGCAGVMVLVMAVLDTLGLLTLTTATMTFALGLFLALQVQLALLRRNGADLRRTRIGVFAPLLFLIPAFLQAA